MKKIILALFVGGLLAVTAMAQKPEGLIRKASVSPVIDGVIDPVWAEADSAYYIDRPTDELYLPTLGEPGETTWKGLWDWNGIYILLSVTDDNFFPAYAADPPGLRWEYDSPELYFDVNFNLEDGLGPVDGRGTGHYQFAPSFDQTKIDGTNTTDADGFSYAFLVDDPNYTAEYFIPFSILKDDQGEQVYKEGEIGFDITMIDRDEGQDSASRAVWSNTGEVEDSWNNMDDCGIITLDEAAVSVYVTTINLTGGEITENNGTLQIIYEVLPENASNKNLNWSVENSDGKARVDKDGVVTGIIDGEVTVTAIAADGSLTEASTTVTISNQVVSGKEVNVIRNGYFDEVNGDRTATGWGFWGGDINPPPPNIYDGIAVCTPADPEEEGAGNYQFWEDYLTAEVDVDYWFMFVAFADEVRTLTSGFEDPTNGWSRYGYSTDPRTSWGGNEGDWTFDITTEPVRYIMDVRFPAENLSEGSNQRMVYHMGSSNIQVYLDSIELISVDDYNRLTIYTPVEAIKVSSAGDATSVSQGETLQMSAEVFPAEADYQTVKWSVVNTVGEATIDANGLLNPVSFGKVTVVASAKDDSGIKDEMEISILGPAGIRTAVADLMKVYPNPAVNELNVFLAQNGCTVSIYSSTGVKMDEVQVRGFEHRFDISHYAPGIYFVRTGNAVARFVK